MTITYIPSTEHAESLHDAARWSVSNLSSRLKAQEPINPQIRHTMFWPGTETGWISSSLLPDSWYHPIFSRQAPSSLLTHKQWAVDFKLALNEFILDEFLMIDEEPHRCRVLYCVGKGLSGSS